MQPRFLADADLNFIIIAALQRRFPEIDFKSALGAGLQGLDDLEVLARAATEGRVLVTHDQSTMPDNFARFIETATSAGVIIAPQSRAPSEIVEDLALIWMASDAAEYANRLLYLPM